MPYVILQSSDNEKFFVDVPTAKNFGTIKNLLSCCGIESEPEGIIPIANVDGETLRKMLDWMDHHKDDAVLKIDPEKDDYSGMDLSDWDQEFLKVDKHLLFKMLVAANYLVVPGLIFITSKEIASMMQGRTPREIREAFNIENDFTAEEEAEIWNENTWLLNN